MTDNIIERLTLAADWFDQPPPPSNPPPGTPLPKMLREAATAIADWQASSEAYRLDGERMRAALTNAIPHLPHGGSVWLDAKSALGDGQSPGEK
jgi:hypothetical protein